MKYWITYEEHVYQTDRLTEWNWIQSWATFRYPNTAREARKALLANPRRRKVSPILMAIK